MIDITKIAAEAIASGLGRDAIYRGPGVLPAVDGLAVKAVPSEADATIEVGQARFGRKAIWFRVYCAEGVLAKGGSLACDGRLYRLTSDPEAADRGRHSWRISARDEGAL
jgi:hypothetical protein